MVVVEKRVLVVDDEEIVRDSCERVLTDAGYVVRTVGSGRDALLACRDEPFDVMLTDLRMPDMDGLDVIRAVASEFPEVRVLVITGYPSRDSAQQAAKLGIFDYLEKPLSPGRLSTATAAALASPPRPSTAPFSDAAPEMTETHGIEAAEPEVAAEADVVETHELEETEPKVAAKTDKSILRMLALLAVAPLLGLAYVVLLPFIGLGVLLVALGTGLAQKLGWVRG